MKSVTQEEVRAVRDLHEPWLRSQPGVVGTGVGMDRGGNICLKVFSNQMPAVVRDAIHQKLGDVPVVIEETGGIRKQTETPS